MYFFKKEERLCSKKLLDELFRNGSSFLLYPYRVTWKAAALPGGAQVQVVISVSKRKFKRAHDRNLLKRRMREAYRLHKAEILYPFINNKPNLLLAISYVGKEINDYRLIEKKMIMVFRRLKEICDEELGE